MTEQALAEEEPHFCTNCGSPVSPGDRFCTNCGADLRAQEVASTELESPVGEQQDSAASTPDVASPVSGSVVSAVAQAKPRRHGLVIGLSVASAVVLVIAVVLSLIATNVIPNPLVRERAVTFSIKAPHYNEKTDSKIPLHITGKTSSGRVISQHVYVSPKAPVVHLAPGQYTVQVEASPLLSSGDVYRIPEPIKIDTAKNVRPIGESQPVVQKLKFEVKPANEVTATDLQAVAKFAKQAKVPAKKLDFLQEKIRRQKVATAFNRVLDMLSTTQHMKSPNGWDTPLAQYSLLDIDQDGTPEMLTWWGVNGDDQATSDGPVGCGEDHTNYSGNRVWKYNSSKDRVECLAGPEVPTPQQPSMQWLNYLYSPEKKMLAIDEVSVGETYITLSHNHLHVSFRSSDQLAGTGVFQNPANSQKWEHRDVFSNITQRDVLALYAMSLPKSLSTEGIEDYEKYALLVSDGTMNGKRYFAGTIKLMTPQQIQDYQHHYVVQHHLDDDFDPTFTTRPKSECSSKEDSSECGNPAALYPANLLIPLVIPEGQIYFPLPADSVFARAPKYLYRISSFNQRSYDSDDYLILRRGEPADNSFAEMLKPYDAKRVILDVTLSYNQYSRPLPRFSWEIDINSVAAELPDSPSQTE